MRITRVVLADDHPVIRAGIRNLLKKAPNIELVGEASNGVEALRLAKDLRPDVLLLDMEMPDMTGLEVARQLKVADSSVHILVLSAYNDRHFIQSVLANGASAYLTKEEAPQVIIETIRELAHRKKEGTAALATDRQDRKQPEDRKMTDQELKIIGWLARGKTDQEIALVLEISESDVKTHLETIFAKLKVSTRVEAAVRAVQKRLI